MRPAAANWDPATGVGAFVTLGAAARAVATNQGLINDPFAEPLVRAAGVDYFIRAIDDEKFADDGGHNRAMTQFMNVLAAHTRCSDEYLAEAGRAGIRQVVILASGLDTRPYRLWWPRGTTVYEIGEPEVLDFKSRTLRDLGAEVTANRCAVGIDVRQDWLAALRRVGFDASRPTVWIAEQLLAGYLVPEQQHRLLHGITGVSPVGSRFAADHMPVWTPLQQGAEQDFVDGWRRHGLDVDLASLAHPAEYPYVPSYLADHGWKTAARTAPAMFAAMGLAVPRSGGGPGEPAFIPEYVTATRT